MKAGSQPSTDSDLVFAPEDSNTSGNLSSDAPWKILIVDDEPDIHKVTRMTLVNFEFDGHGLEFLSAYSAQQAKDILLKENDIAVALIDVVMESEHAGLDLVKYIRDDLDNELIRLILRTGQPGQAPESKVISEYEINDYKEKTELTSQKLYSSIYASLRSYRDLIALKNSRSGLENVINVQTTELNDERNFISTVFDITGALVVVLDTDGNIIRHNQACESITGFNFNEYKYRPIWEWLIPEDDRDEAKQIFNNLKNMSGALKYESRWLTKHGDTRLISWSNTIIQNQLDNVQYFVSTGIDISERYNAEIKLKEAKKEAEKANAAKSEFLARMSHELRTPLNAILGFGQILEMESGEFNATQQDNIKEIIKAGYYLLNLINDVLDLSKIEAGKIDVTIKDIHLSELIDECLALIVPIASKREIELISQKNNNDYVVRADLICLKQVLLNILSNSVKYNHEHGQVSVKTELATNHRIRISITDAGIGLDKNDIDKLFIPFERLNMDNKIEGTGIGLVITKHLIEAMGGSIGVESTLGEGSTFWIELDLFHTEKE